MTKRKIFAAVASGVIAACAVSRVLAYDDVRFGKRVKFEEADKPVAVASFEGRFFVLDGKKDSLFVLDEQGRLKKTIGRSGSQKDNLSGPRGLAIAPNGSVFIADTNNSRVQVVDAKGDFAGSWGSKGSEPGELRYPQSLALGADGRVYVADTGNHRIQVFTRDGIYLFGFGEKGKEPGKFSSPTRVEIDPSGYLYVLDSGNGRIQKIDPRGKFVKEFNLVGTDFTVDEYGFVYMLDPKAGKVREMGPDGTILGAFSSRGTGKGQLNQPVFIQSAGEGMLLVLDRGTYDMVGVQVTNKLKTEPLPPDLSSNLLITGPERTVPVAATRLAADPEGPLYAWDSKERQFVSVDSAGKVRMNFGRKAGKDPSGTKDCGGLAVGPSRNIFVSDVGTARIQNFDSSGQFISDFAGSTGFFDSGKREGRVRNPQGLAVTEKGTVYVADAGNRRVEAFGPDGTFLFSFGPQIGKAELKNPISVVWDKAGFVYVLDRELKTVFKCQPSGAWVAQWGGAGEGAGQFLDPVSMAYDGNDYLYILDAGARRIAVFSRNGGWMTNFFSRGSGERVLREPAALAVQGNNLWIADPGEGKIVSFALHPRLEPPASISTSVVEGEVTLRWSGVSEGWAGESRVLRSTNAVGPYQLIGATGAAEFKDTKVESYRTYYYRVATESKTKDVGPASPPAAVFVPGTFNRPPVEITSVDIGNIFSANYKYYKENPVGKITLTNNVNVPFEGVKVSFLLKDFMDFATDTVIQKIGTREKVELPLKAVLNNRVLDVTEDTPVQAQFTVAYYEGGKPLSISLNKPLRVYARNAIVWDKPERIVTFITSNDTPVKDFERKVLGQNLAIPPSAERLNPALMTAMKLWDALGAYGLKYQRAPNNPFEEVSKDPAFPEDYTQFPRETLRLKSGQCDDLATLTAALFESAGVRSALLDYPGHMALMFDTGSTDPTEAGLPESQMILYKDTYWVPIEATVVGSSLGQAQRLAAREYQEMRKRGQATIIDPREAWAVFEPATMQPADWTAEPPKPDETLRRFSSDAAEYAKERYRYLTEAFGQAAAKEAGPESFDRLALLEVEMGHWEKAADGFGKALAMDSHDAAALNNMGGVAFVRGDYPKAESFFGKASQEDPEDPGIWLNRAKCAAKLEKPDQVKKFCAKAVALNSGDAELKAAADALTR